MKLKFKNQQFQTDAVDAVADLFKGQEKSTASFSITSDPNMCAFMQNEYGIGNALQIDIQTLQENMHAVQKRNNLPLTEIQDKQHPAFCLEMETGTGKTYVYTKTIFELNKRYGFTKFIVVVPSVAIREGVHKSLQITAEHFGNEYNNVPCRYFIYNSAKLNDVRQFATNANIEIMIINIDAFKKAENIINQVQDKLNGETAMRYIQDTNPVVIIDEPQSVDNTLKAKEAIASLNPLCVLRYSATHREKINLLYRLTPVDAYNMGLVKQICVSSNQVANDFNKPYIKLLSVTKDGGFKAKLEIDCKNKDGIVSRKIVTAKHGDDLFLLSGGRELYDGYAIDGIDCTPGMESVEFSNTEYVALGKAIGGVDENLLKEAQIRRTIEAHLSKELMYLDKGIKVLSLFFIDRVEKYRTADGGKGIYAEMFEKCYAELMAKPKFAPLKEKFTADISKLHNGYFSQDKKGVYKDTKGDTLADDDTYTTIMRDKEWLLSFGCPLRFIFSHSALKEGWDNPNVFQVCTLIEQKSTFTCRQKVGRGLRLCVDQDGNRIEDKNINVLHVMANESFAEFAETLQKEIETETGVKFGVLELGLFTGITFTEKVTEEKKISKEEAAELVEKWTSDGTLEKWLADPDMMKAEEKITARLESGELTAPPNPATEVLRQYSLGASKEEMAKAIENITCTVTTEVEKAITYDDAAEIMEHFEKKDYITKSGKIKDTMKNALLSGTLDLPAKYEAARARFESIIKTADSKPPIRDASREVVVKLNKQVLISPEFKELWDKIKQKTTYRVNFDVEKLIEGCIADMKEMPAIAKARIISQTADIDIEKKGVTFKEREMRTMDLSNTYDALPDILRIVSEEARIKKSDVRRILEESGRAKDFMNNPQAFLEKMIEVVRRNCAKLDIEGIRYVKLDGQYYYAQEIFAQEELAANLDKNAVAVKNSIYDYVVYDSSTIEKPFAVSLDNDPDVKLFFKIPSRFKIDTPIGSYNPDWAVYLTKNGEEKLYFVLETKGTTDPWGLRTPEQLKIHCGKEHFKAIGEGLQFDVATGWNDFRKTKV